MDRLEIKRIWDKIDLIPEVIEFEEIGDGKKRRFLQAYAMCGQITRAAIEAKVCSKTPQNWLKHDKEFILAFEVAREAWLSFDKDVLEQIAAERIQDRTAPMSSVLLMHRLKARGAEYRDTIQGGISVGTLNVEFSLPRPPMNLIEERIEEHKGLIEGEVIEHIEG